MSYSTNRDEARGFAERIVAMGFRVWLAYPSSVSSSGAYGFISDASESRVLSFSFTDGGSLGGNYGPASTTSGSGWRMDERPWQLVSAADVRKALYAAPPTWCGNGWRYYSTVAHIMAEYGPSSKYVEFKL